MTTHENIRIVCIVIVSVVFLGALWLAFSPRKDRAPPKEEPERNDSLPTYR